MTFDSEEHKQMVQELLDRAQFPAAAAEKVASFMRAMRRATVGNSADGKKPKRAAA